MVLAKEVAMSNAVDLSISEDRLLPWKRVRELTGLSRTTVWRRQKAGDFPAPVVISPGRVGWRESDIVAWASSRRMRGPTIERDPQPMPAPRIAPATALAATTVRRKASPVTPARAKRPATSRAKRGQSSNQIHFDF